MPTSGLNGVSGSSVSRFEVVVAASRFLFGPDATTAATAGFGASLRLFQLQTNFTNASERWTSFERLCDDAG